MWEVGAWLSLQCLYPTRIFLVSDLRRVRVLYDRGAVGDALDPTTPRPIAPRWTNAGRHNGDAKQERGEFELSQNS